MAKTERLQKFYNSLSWQKARDYKIASVGYLCEVCGGVGEIVHHKIPLTEANMQNPKISIGNENLQLVCRSCHKRIHDELDGKGRRIRFDKDGNIEPY